MSSFNCGRPINVSTLQHRHAFARAAPYSKRCKSCATTIRRARFVILQTSQLVNVQLNTAMRYFAEKSMGSNCRGQRISSTAYRRLRNIVGIGCRCSTYQTFTVWDKSEYLLTHSWTACRRCLSFLRKMCPAKGECSIKSTQKRMRSREHVRHNM